MTTLKMPWKQLESPLGMVYSATLTYGEILLCTVDAENELKSGETYWKLSFTHNQRAKEELGKVFDPHCFMTVPPGEDARELVEAFGPILLSGCPGKNES